MKVIGLTRGSTEEQVCTLAAQTEKIRGFAAAFGHELVDIFEDAGQSGKSLNRPGLQAALEAIRDGRAQGLLVAKLCRLSRSVVDLDTLVRTYFADTAKYHAALLVVDQHIDTGTAHGRMLLNVLMSINQGERELIAERTRAALQHLKSQGVKLGGVRAAATLADPLTVARVMELRAAGKTLRDIAGALTAEGYDTLRGGKWGAETVRKILAREAA